MIATIIVCYAITAACAFALGWTWARDKTEDEIFVAALAARADAYARGFDRAVKLHATNE